MKWAPEAKGAGAHCAGSSSLEGPLPVVEMLFSRGEIMAAAWGQT
jgi:hypothetical protein